jgi:hypothetical protein
MPAGTWHHGNLVFIYLQNKWIPHGGRDWLYMSALSSHMNFLFLS